MSGESVLSLREMLHGLFHYWDEHISKDGAWWILALDSVLFIPLIFAVFFYPMAVLAIIVSAAVLTLGFMGLRRLVHGRR
ncbi:MAG: hypothetical protein HYU37_02330 [Acidobacteria bacterium]|nr:hypothetical protein [Acidobacteriota bacterium]